MSRKFLVNLDLNRNQILNAVAHINAGPPATPTEGQMYQDSGTHKFQVFNGTGWVELGTVPAHDAAAHSAIKISDLAAPDKNVAWAGWKITGLGDPTGDQDAATKIYVDGVAQGLDFKSSVAVCASTNGVLATAYANGQVVDGVTLVTGMRILLAGQTTASERGIFTVKASGAPDRAADGDASGDISPGAIVFVEPGGTSWGSTQWVCSATNATPWLPGASTSTWTQFSGASATAAGAGLTASGQVWAVGAGTGISVGADSVGVDTTVVARKYTTATHASATSVAVTHGLGNQWVNAQAFLVSDNTLVECDVTLTDANTVTFGFAVAPALNTIRFVITG